MKSGISSNKPADDTVLTKTTESDTATKMERATTLYMKLIAVDRHIQRKDVIEQFVKQCELTPAGAATYYNTIKKRVKSKTDNTRK